MGLLDGLLGNLMGSYLEGSQERNPFGSGNQTQGGNLLLQIALSILQQNGGVEGVLGKFRQGGLAQHADSWVSTGQNMNISADQLQQVFGSSTISRAWVCRRIRPARQWLRCCRTSSTDLRRRDKCPKIATMNVRKRCQRWQIASY